MAKVKPSILLPLAFLGLGDVWARSDQQSTHRPSQPSSAQVIARKKRKKRKKRRDHVRRNQGKKR